MSCDWCVSVFLQYTIRPQGVLVFTTRPPHHSSSHVKRWWIHMWWTQISISLEDSQRVALDWHDLALPYHKNVYSGGITLFSIRWDLSHMLCLFTPPSLVSYVFSPFPLPPHQLSSCADVSSLSQLTLTLFNICFSLSLSSWVRLWEWSVHITSPVCSLGSSVTAPVK